MVRRAGRGLGGNMPALPQLDTDVNKDATGAITPAAETKPSNKNPWPWPPVDWQIQKQIDDAQKEGLAP